MVSQARTTRTQLSTSCVPRLPRDAVLQFDRGVFGLQRTALLGSWQPCRLRVTGSGHRRPALRPAPACPAPRAARRGTPRSGGRAGRPAADATSRTATCGRNSGASMISTASRHGLPAKAARVTSPMPRPRATSDILRSALSASTPTRNGSRAASRLRRPPQRPVRRTVPRRRSGRLGARRHRLGVGRVALICAAGAALGIAALFGVWIGNSA